MTNRVFDTSDLLKTNGALVYSLRTSLPMERDAANALKTLLGLDLNLPDEFGALQEYLTPDRKEYVFTDGEFSGQDQDSIVALCKFIIQKRQSSEKTQEE